MDTQNKPVWFITGCSTGVGRELVKLLISKGYNTVITARDTTKVEDLAEGNPDNTLVLPLDVTDKAQIAAAVEQATAKFGRIDVLVNNAGYGYFSSIEEGEEQKVRDQFETNFFGLVNMTQAVLPGMRKQGSGRIVNFSSIGGLRSFMATGFYHATKFAVEGLSESLAQEVASVGIKVIIVEPGPFRTDWAGRSTARTETQIDEYKETIGQRMQSSLDSSGRQVGDPVRGSQAIIDAVESADPQLRLLLGEIAYNLAIEKLDMLHKNFEQTKELTISADFPENER